MADILSIERHTIKTWRDRYNLPSVKEDKFIFCCSPLYFHWHCIRQAMDRKRDLPDDPALLVAISHLIGEQNTAQTTQLIEKGFTLPKTKALLYVGMAAEWIRTNLVQETHIKIQ